MDLAQALQNARGRVDQVRLATDQSGQAIECCAVISEQLEKLRPLSGDTGAGILNQVSSLMQEYLDQICCEDAPRKEDGGIDPEEIPQSEAPAPKKKERRPQHQVALDTVRFLTVVLSQARIPASIEKALELAYGEGWRDDLIVRPTGPGQIIKIRREDDLANTAGSVFKKKIHDSLLKVRQYQEDTCPDGVDVSDHVIRLAELLKRHRWTTIQSRMTAWGL